MAMATMSDFVKDVELERGRMLAVAIPGDSAFTNMPWLIERIETRLNLLKTEDEGMAASEKEAIYLKLLAEMGAIACIGYESYHDSELTNVVDRRGKNDSLVH